ncbi:MAG: hypothetical protein QM727_14340 [Niabella sp.]
MKKIKDENTYQGFSYPCKSLVKFVNTLGIFTIMLKSGRIVHFQPDNIEDFRQWLIKNNIEDIKNINKNRAD